MYGLNVIMAIAYHFFNTTSINVLYFCWILLSCAVCFMLIELENSVTWKKPICPQLLLKYGTQIEHSPCGMSLHNDTHSCCHIHLVHTLLWLSVPLQRTSILSFETRVALAHMLIVYVCEILCLCVPQYWNDCYLQWDVSAYSGVNTVRFPDHLIWKPDILLYNRWVLSGQTCWVLQCNWISLMSQMVNMYCPLHSIKEERKVKIWFVFLLGEKHLFVIHETSQIWFDFLLLIFTQDSFLSIKQKAANPIQKQQFKYESLLSY